jgi:caffeoyl-CoA O-methyltransferase
MLTLVPDEIERYAVAHSSAVPELFERMREETYANQRNPQMQVGPLEGRFLKLLVQLSGARRAVEVGTFTGYSGLSIAEGLPDDGVLFSCDVDDTATAVARRYWGESPHGRKIEFRLGPALETLPVLPEPLDFVFLDADKENYVRYWEILLPKLRPGGLVVCDNTLWSGRVLEPRSESDRAIVAFNTHARSDARVELVLLTVRDGMTLARKR